METKHNFKLIDGQFDPREAKSILFALINSKINFHTMESFSIKERTGADTSFHENRIKELAQSNVDIKNLLEYAEGHKFSLRIDGNIEIKLIHESKFS